jgi:pimeloyl-ACP methyl ester carboxylesterase
MLVRIIRWGITIIVGLILLVVVGFFTYRIYLERSTRIRSPNGISSLEQVTLGNMNQWIFIRSIDKDNPILVFLHGGPGAPLCGIPNSRVCDAELIKHYTVVHWDQRGAGKSYDPSIPVDSMTLDRFVEDCNELIDYLRDRLQAEKVYLVAHSGGTVIGLKTAYRYPEKIHAYVGVCQVINELEGQKASYEFLLEQAEKAGNANTLKKIEEMGSPPFETPEGFLKMESLVGQFGGFTYGKGAMMGMMNLMIHFLASPEYSLVEGFNTVRNLGFVFTMNAMWDELKDVDLSEEIQSIQVPVYFFEGKHDMVTPTVVVEKFYDQLEAENGKELIIFEGSGHMPMIEEKEKYHELLIHHVLAERHGE